jgi:hypothetical protein
VGGAKNVGAGKLERDMLRTSLLLTFLLGLGTGVAGAQSLNLTGTYICINCPPGQARVGHITQGDGRDINLVNELGQASRGYVDYPGRIWTFEWNEGAIVSPDGLTIQFDRRPVWRRQLH